jgi:predicted DNA-binding transcriptional regulator AlpA
MTKENILQNRMMRMRQVTKYCALSRAYIYQKITEGTFPPGHMISPGIRAWQKSEVDKWLDAKIMGRSV